MFYRGFEGNHSFEPDEGMYIGCIMNVEHFVQYTGKTPEELEENFKTEVDKYIKFLYRTESF